MSNGTSFAKIAAGVGCGVAGALLLVVLLGLGTCAACAGNFATNMAEVEAKKAARLAALELEDVTGRYERQRFVVKGTVRNGGPDPVSYAKVEVTVFDASERPLDTKTTYAISSDALAPGSAKSWDVMFFDVDGIETYAYKVTD